MSCFCRYQTLAVATDANTKEDIGNKKVSGKKLTVIKNWGIARLYKQNINRMKYLQCTPTLI